MFDEMIESDSGKAAGGRGRFFMVSALAVGTLFLSAVAYSLYAADFDLGVGDLEISRIVVPDLADQPEPPEQQDPAPQRNNTDINDVPIRTDHIAQMNEHQDAPTTISVTPSTVRERPPGYYKIGERDFDPASFPGGIAGTSTSRSSGGPLSGVSADPAPVAETKTPPPPPPVERKTPPPPQSKGVVNGLATFLPPPPYPQTARTMRVEGNVSVQVTISETGKVLSAKAVSGHALLKNAAEKAAWNAKFSPTYLSDEPVKVTGVIVYKFNLN